MLSNEGASKKMPITHKLMDTLSFVGRYHRWLIYTLIKEKIQEMIVIVIAFGKKRLNEPKL